LWAQRVDSTGTIRWKKEGVPISVPQGGNEVRVTSNHAGGAIFAWQDKRHDPIHSYTHIYAQNVTKGGGLGSGVFTAVVENGQAGLPSAISLSQNYPNPFNPSTTIRYELPKASHVTLKVFNVLGQEVAVLVDEMQDAGFKSVAWDASGFASGVYFYRMQAGTIIETKKLILIK